MLSRNAYVPKILERPWDVDICKSQLGGCFRNIHVEISMIQTYDDILIGRN